MRLAIVPEGTNSAASFSNVCATRSSKAVKIQHSKNQDTV